jgi:small GTP-binding protein
MSEDMKLVVLGTGGVGKSAITVQFIQGTFLEKYDPTIEDSYRKPYSFGGRSVLLDILDTAGQDEFGTMRDSYMRESAGFVLVYAVTSRASLEALAEFREEILRAKDADEVPVLVVGNKCDLEDQREVPEEDGRRLAATWGAGFTEASAKTRHNINEIFESIVTAVWKANDAAAPVEEGDEDKKKKKKKKGCAVL